MDKTKDIDPNLIYARALVLSQNNQVDSDLTIQSMLTHELYSSPLSLFFPNVDMRTAKNKSSLKNKLKLEVGTRRVHPKIKIVDASAILWVVSWPSKGASVQDFVTNVRCYLQRLLQIHDVYFIFDRYYQRSIKNQTRSTRSNGVTRRFTLSLKNELPSKKVILGVTENKKTDDQFDHKRLSVESQLYRRK